MTPPDFSAVQAAFAPYARYVPGFAFLQGLAGSAAAPAGQAPAMAQWVAPVFDPDELERRIRDLRAVHFWLEQNARAVQATIQALEVQRMTLATLKGLNVSLGEVAQAWAPGAAGGSPRADAVSGEAPASGADPAPQAPSGGDAAAPAVDPMRWWQALTEQFQGIAQRTLQEMTQQAAAAMAPVPPAPAPTATAASGEAPARTGRKTPARRAAPAPGASAPAPAAARRSRR